jgi:hypothetical protein
MPLIGFPANVRDRHDASLRPYWKRLKAANARTSNRASDNAANLAASGRNAQ